jgi:hypothetical protein
MREDWARRNAFAYRAEPEIIEFGARLRGLTRPDLPLPADPLEASVWRETWRELDEQLDNWQPLGIFPTAEAIAEWERNKRAREWWYAQRDALRRAPAHKRTTR